MIRRLCALLLALAAGWACPVAAAGTGADMLSEAEIARLAELGFDALPLTAVVEMVSAREPAWPFEANPDAVDARQLACVRSRMGTDHLRQAMLERTREHARVDPSGLREGLRFLEDGGAVLFRASMRQAVEAAVDGTIPDAQALEASATPEQRHATMALLLAEHYRPLRALFGMPEPPRHDFETGVAVGATMVRVLLAPVLTGALEACAVPLSVLDAPAPVGKPAPVDEPPPIEVYDVYD